MSLPSDLGVLETRGSRGTWEMLPAFCPPSPPPRGGGVFLGSVGSPFGTEARSMCVYAPARLYGQGSVMVINSPQPGFGNISSFLAHSAHPPQGGRGSSLCHAPSGLQDDAIAIIGNTVVTGGAGSSLCLEMTPVTSAPTALFKTCHMAQHDLK